jgi:hypothetical protein
VIKSEGEWQQERVVGEANRRVQRAVGGHRRLARPQKVAFAWGSGQEVVGVEREGGHPKNPETVMQPKDLDKERIARPRDK